MFAYCGNNPIAQKDPSGEFGVVFWSGVVAACASGISNAISTAATGGTLEECLIAGAIGVASGAAGYLFALAFGFSPQAAVLARGISSFICDTATTYVRNGSISETDWGLIGLDVCVDMCYSTTTYYYTALIANDLQRTVTGTAIDGIIDVGESIIYDQAPAELQRARRQYYSTKHSHEAARRKEAELWRNYYEFAIK